MWYKALIPWFQQKVWIIPVFLLMAYQIKLTEWIIESFPASSLFFSKVYRHIHKCIIEIDLCQDSMISLIFIYFYGNSLYITYFALPWWITPIHLSPFLEMSENIFETSPTCLIIIATIVVSISVESGSSPCSVVFIPPQTRMPPACLQPGHERPEKKNKGLMMAKNHRVPR